MFDFSFSFLPVEVDIKLEDIDPALLALYMLNWSDSPQRIGKRTDEDGVEHEVWQHTFVPSTIAYPSQMVISYTSATLSNRRRNKRKKRQRKAAQRKHHKGAK